MTLWIILVAAGLLTYAIRLSFILLWGKIDVPTWLVRALRFVPPAVLTAIFVPELILPGGQLDISAGNSRLIAGVLAILVAWRTRNIALTILVGMVILILLQALPGLF
jgi:branched-subunit amino acid transport protein